LPACPEVLIEDCLVENLTGSEMMASVWPSIEDASSNWDEVRSLGLVAQTFAPVDIAGFWQNKYVHVIDSTNPATRQFLWSQLQQNYYQNGIRNFWLDEDEGGQVANDAYPWTDYALGPGDQYAMLYPYFHQMGIYEGQLNASGSTEPTAVSLTRSSWAGSQRFASGVWSGDIL
jgi:alpha-D-xyloside xylohydrolase